MRDWIEKIKIIFIFFIFNNVIFSLNTDKLLKSQTEALNIYKKDKFSAVGIMEKAGIEELVESGIPKSLSKNQYVSILNDYAFYQIECKRYDKAIEILNIVLEVDYQRAVAHYNLGECYLYKAEENSENEENDLSLAKISFSNYAKLLKIGAKIPSKVKEYLGSDLDLILKLKEYNVSSNLKIEITNALEEWYETESFFVSFVIPIRDTNSFVVVVDGITPYNGCFIYEDNRLKPISYGLTSVMYLINNNYIVVKSSSMDSGLFIDEYYAINLSSGVIKLLYKGLSDGESGGYGRGEEIGIVGNVLLELITEQKLDILKLKITEETKEFKPKKYVRTFKFWKNNIEELK